MLITLVSFAGNPLSLG